MRRIWLDSYPPEVQAEINLNEFASVSDVLTSAVRRFPDRPAFRSLGTTLTYSELGRLSFQFAAALQHLRGIEPRARIALMMPNLLQYPVAMFGVLRAGMSVVNINPLYTPRELEHQLNDSGAEAIILLENFAHTLEKVLPSVPRLKHVITTQAGDLTAAPRRWLINQTVKHIRKAVPRWHIPRAIGFRQFLSSGARHTLEPCDVGSERIAFLQYTGGTTGRSKGAILTHGNIVANLLQASAWSSQILGDGCEVAITALPLYHIFSLTISCIFFVKLGGTQILIANPRDLPAFVRDLKTSRFTVMTGVNTLFNGLLNTPGFNDVDFSHLKFCIGGGAAIHPSVAHRWEEVTGRPLVEGYGLTEASPLVSCNPLMSRYSGTIGLPMPSTEICIRDDHDITLPPGAAGEICVRGPQVMRGYWQQPEETKLAITEDGWLRTGDIGVMDEAGYMRVTDRKKDMILTSGFNVYPNEIESIISSMPGVLEAAVIGVPHPVMGEVIKAFVVKRDGDVTADGVIAYCREHLTNYKVPKIVEFRADLPKNPIGKVLRRELRCAEPAAVRVAHSAT